LIQAFALAFTVGAIAGVLMMHLVTGRARLFGNV